MKLHKSLLIITGVVVIALLVSACGAATQKEAPTTPGQPPTQAAPVPGAELQLAGSWEGTQAWTGLAFHISFSVAEGSSEVSDLKMTVTCPGSTAPDGKYTFPPAKIEKNAFSAFGTEGNFVSATQAEGTFNSGIRITCGQTDVPVSGKWTATKAQ